MQGNLLKLNTTKCLQISKRRIFQVPRYISGRNHCPLVTSSDNGNFSPPSELNGWGAIKLPLIHYYKSSPLNQPHLISIIDNNYSISIGSELLDFITNQQRQSRTLIPTRKSDKKLTPFLSSADVSLHIQERKFIKGLHRDPYTNRLF